MNSTNLAVLRKRATARAKAAARGNKNTLRLGEALAEAGIQASDLARQKPTEARELARHSTADLTVGLVGGALSCAVLPLNSSSFFANEPLKASRGACTS